MNVSSKPRFFESAADFRRWLDKHHAAVPELVIGFYKDKKRKGGLTYSEALDAALSFGWIDGVRKRIDADTYMIRFTPRKRGSIWSEVNIRRARELIARRRMEPALEARLRANAVASSFFDAQPPGYRKLIVCWIMSAKREETRVRRMDRLIGSHRNQWISIYNHFRRQIVAGVTSTKT